MKRIKRRALAAALSALVSISCFTVVPPASGATVIADNKLGENIAVARAIAEEGTVLLKNDYGALPLKQNDIVAGLGVAQDDGQVFGGSGSGWVNSNGAFCYRDGMMRVANIKRIASYKPIGSADDGGTYSKILYFYGSSTTEGSDRSIGDYYLSNTAKTDIEKLIRNYGKERIIVILNVGAVCDTSWLIEKDVAAIVLAYYGGEQAGVALADVLTGAVSPSGKTVDTWAKSYDCYPSSNASGIGTFGGDRNTYYTEDVYVGYRYFATFDPEYEKVNYEFGYGLSYTEFELFDRSCTYDDGKFTVRITVKNVGAYAGKEVVQVYLCPPKGVLGAPAAELVGFAKTSVLTPESSETVTVEFDESVLARYDDVGRIKVDSWVIEQGEYGVYVGTSVKDACARTAIYTHNVASDLIPETTGKLRDTTLPSRLTADGTTEILSDAGSMTTEYKIPSAGSVLIQAENYKEKGSAGTAEIYHVGTDIGFGMGNINRVGAELTYELDVEKAGIYNIGFNLASFVDKIYDMFTVYVNDTPQNFKVNMSASHTGDDNEWFKTSYLKSDSYKIELPAGKVRLKFVGNGDRFVNFDSFVIYGSSVSDSVPTHIEAENYLSYSKGTERIADGAATARSSVAGSVYEYKLNVESAGRYYISFKASNVKKASADALSVYVDGVATDTRIALRRTASDGNVLESNYHTFTDTVPVALELPQGETVLRFVTKDESVCCIDSFTLIPESEYVAVSTEFEDNTAEYEVEYDTSGKTLDTLITYDDVYAHPEKLDDFVSQLSVEQLVRLLGVDKDQTDIGTGVGGVGGKYIDKQYKIPFANTADGPAGIHYWDETLYATWFPCLTMLASTWNTALAKDFARGLAAEAVLGGVQVWHAPGVNIHRNPLCGRNFEYFSEDPLIAGVFAAEIVRNVQLYGVSVCVKHYAANNQETNRFGNNSSVSVRALREIYLKPFETVVKTARPYAVMSSYNMVNGLHVASSSDLITTVLRDDWGFDGVVFSDWGPHMSHISLVKSGNTFKSSTPEYDTLVKAYLSGVLTRADIERNAKDALEFIIKSSAHYQVVTPISESGKTEIAGIDATKTVTDEHGTHTYFRFTITEAGLYTVDISAAGVPVKDREGRLIFGQDEPIFFEEGIYELEADTSENPFLKIVFERKQNVDPSKPDEPDKPDPIKPDDTEKPVKPSEPDNYLGGGAIAGIVLGSCAFVAVGAAVVVIARRKSKKK